MGLGATGGGGRLSSGVSAWRDDYVVVHVQRTEKGCASEGITVSPSYARTGLETRVPENARERDKVSTGLTQPSSRWKDEGKVARGQLSFWPGLAGLLIGVNYVFCATTTRIEEGNDELAEPTTVKQVECLTQQPSPSSRYFTGMKLRELTKKKKRNRAKKETLTTNAWRSRNEKLRELAERKKNSIKTINVNNTLQH